MVQKALDIAGETGMKAVRPDVPGRNISAEKLYQGLGFQCRATLQRYDEETGRTDFKRYEYVLWGHGPKFIVRFLSGSAGMGAPVSPALFSRAANRRVIQILRMDNL